MLVIIPAAMQRRIILVSLESPVTLPPTPKTQLYVSQDYLEAWVTGGTIACYRQRERKAFRPGTKKHRHRNLLLQS
jgi:hypothetical protein